MNFFINSKVKEVKNYLKTNPNIVGNSDRVKLTDISIGLKGLDSFEEFDCISFNLNLFEKIYLWDYCRIFFKKINQIRKFNQEV